MRVSCCRLLVVRAYPWSDWTYSRSSGSDAEADEAWEERERDAVDHPVWKSGTGIYEPVIPRRVMRVPLADGQQCRDQ